MSKRGEKGRLRHFTVGFPPGETGDRVVAGLEGLDLDGLQAVLAAKRRLERAGLVAEAVLGVLDARIELGAELLNRGGRYLLIGCRRQDAAIDILGLSVLGDLRRPLERAARAVYELPHASLEWLVPGG